MQLIKAILLALALLVSDTFCAKPRIESAIFTCGYALFDHEEVAMLFPPSDISVFGMRNITAAEELHRRGVSSFCKHLKTYSSCVRDNLFDLPNDELVKIYIDIENFQRLFGFFCQNKQLIMRQFRCTVISVLRNRCPYGGVYGIIAQVSSMIREPKSKEEFCMNVRQSIDCRIGHQLSMCDGKYADVMAWIYSGLIGSYCPLPV